jgi:hypothetical protein
MIRSRVGGTAGRSAPAYCGRPSFFSAASIDVAEPPWSRRYMRANIFLKTSGRYAAPLEEPFALNAEWKWLK